MVLSYDIQRPTINTLEIAILQCKNEGGIWDYNSGTCLKKSTTSTSISCPSGEQLIGSVCVPIQTSCPTGYEQNPNGQGCIPIVINKQTSCPTGYNLVNGQCVLIQSSTTKTTTGSTTSTTKTTTGSTTSTTKTTTGSTTCPTGYNLVNGQCVLIQSSTTKTTTGSTTSTSSTSSTASTSNLTEILMKYKYEIIGALFVIIIIYYIARK